MGLLPLTAGQARLKSYPFSQSGPRRIRCPAGGFSFWKMSPCHPQRLHYQAPNQIINSMATTHALSAHTRKRSGSGALTSLRAEGLIPGVVYGKDQPATNVRLNRKTLETVLHHSVSEHILIHLTLDEAAAPTLVLIKDVQHNPLNGNVLHVDFHAIRENELIHSIVPLELTGECVGAKAGGLVEHLVHDLHITCLPKNLPDQIHVDISTVEIGGALHTRELTLPAGVTTHLGPDVVIMLVAAPRVVEVVAVAAVDPKAKKKAKK